MVCDCSHVRTSISGRLRIELSLILKLVQQLIAKDIAKMSLPVSLYELFSVLMKPAEFDLKRTWCAWLHIDVDDGSGKCVVEE